MNLEIKDGKLVIDPLDLLETISGDQQLQLIQSLSCQDAVVKHVADQIIDGFTEDGYRAPRTCGAQTEPTCALDVAIRRIAESSSEIAGAEIKHLIEEIGSLNKRLHSAYDEIERLRKTSRSYT